MCGHFFRLTFRHCRFLAIALCALLALAAAQDADYLNDEDPKPAPPPRPSILNRRPGLAPRGKTTSTTTTPPPPPKVKYFVGTLRNCSVLSLFYTPVTWHKRARQKFVILSVTLFTNEMEKGRSVYRFILWINLGFFNMHFLCIFFMMLRFVNMFFFLWCVLILIAVIIWIILTISHLQLD